MECSLDESTTFWHNMHSLVPLEPLSFQTCFKAASSAISRPACHAYLYTYMYIYLLIFIEFKPQEKTYTHADWQLEPCTARTRSGTWLTAQRPLADYWRRAEVRHAREVFANSRKIMLMKKVPKKWSSFRPALQAYLMQCMRRR